MQVHTHAHMQEHTHTHIHKHTVTHKCIFVKTNVHTYTLINTHRDIQVCTKWIELCITICLQHPVTFISKAPTFPVCFTQRWTMNTNPLRVLTDTPHAWSPHSSCYEGRCSSCGRSVWGRCAKSGRNPRWHTEPPGRPLLPPGTWCASGLCWAVCCLTGRQSRPHPPLPLPPAGP